MCLLVTQSKFSPALYDEWLADFYSYNQDGIGVMYSENDTLIIEKALPANAEAFISFYRTHIQGRDCAFHLRMRTHGNIDLDNCHPYEVLNRKDHGLDLWLMHNGVLSSGNSADVTKSDTWHYIRDVLRPMLADNAEFVHHPSFAEIVGKHIGDGNKFVLCDNTGRMVTINKDAGVYWAGLWLSNEYAWSASVTAKDTPFDDPLKAIEQANEKPVKYKYTQPLNYGAGAYSAYDSESEAWVNTISDLLDDLESNGLKKAGQIDFQDALDFAERFGIDAFKDLYYMVLSAEIRESQFLQYMADHDTALKALPWLADCEFSESNYSFEGDFYEYQ